MGLNTILRNARDRDRRIDKVRAGFATLTFDDKGLIVAEFINELRAGPPKPPRRPRKPKASVNAPVQAPKPKTTREWVTEVLAAHAPLNAAGIHAVIERTAPGAVIRDTVSHEVSVMLSKGLLVKAGSVGRARAVALANGGNH